jgi:hypothetical protein
VWSISPGNTADADAVATIDFRATFARDLEPGLAANRLSLKSLLLSQLGASAIFANYLVAAAPAARAS